MKIALFKMCENCGRHGHIAYSDGTTSKECATKRQARELVRVLVGLHIDEAEAKALIEMIDATDLVESNPLLEKHCDNLTELLKEVLKRCRRS